MSRVSGRSIRVATVLGLILAGLATSAQAEVIKRGAVTVYKVDQSSQASSSTIDFVNAKPFPLPEAPESASVAAQQDLMNNLANRYQSSAAPIASGQSLGSVGTGVTKPVQLGTPEVASETMEDEGGVESQQFGTLNHPFSSARADLSSPTNTQYPYRASGKLFFNKGASTFVCSASLIKRGVIVTAAHCVSQQGASLFYTNFTFVPGYRNNIRPFGTWTSSSVSVMTAYFAGAAGQCLASAPGVICKDDVALIELTAQTSPVFPGTSTGFYGYAFGNTGFTPTTFLTHITQTGYPVALDNGQLMQRNDSQGFRSATNLNNTIIGSLMTGGSSGGPWLNNFGYRPTLNGTTFGTFSSPNVVVGVTSWGYVSSSPKEQGASPFTSTNIVPLINAVCGNPVTDARCL